MINKYNRQQERIFTLNDRGYRQAQRNDSHQMYFNLKTDGLCSLGKNNNHKSTRNNNKKHLRPQSMIIPKCHKLTKIMTKRARSK